MKVAVFVVTVLVVVTVVGRTSQVDLANLLDPSTDQESKSHLLWTGRYWTRRKWKPEEVGYLSGRNLPLQTEESRMRPSSRVGCHNILIGYELI